MKNFTHLIFDQGSAFAKLSSGTSIRVDILDEDYEVVDLSTGDIYQAKSPGQVSEIMKELQEWNTYYAQYYG